MCTTHTLLPIEKPYIYDLVRSRAITLSRKHVLPIPFNEHATYHGKCDMTQIDALFMLAIQIIIYFDVFLEFYQCLAL
jgi:hypothetical protein